MNPLSKSVISTGGVAAAALLLALASPRAVHAIGAELVRISNTADAPGIVEDVSHLASHTVSLTGEETNEGSVPLAEVGPDGTATTGDFVVPAGQKFVITVIELTNISTTSALAELTSSNNGGFYGAWQVPVAGTTEFQYPSGVVVASGTNLALSAVTGGVYVAIHGYLTSN
jgi:hypothetical protein